MIIELLTKIEGVNDLIFGNFDVFIEATTISDWLKDAICDSVHLVPFLFFIFLLIEIFENYFSSKIKALTGYSKKIGPVIGAILAGLPQCGFSVIATPLYINKIITRGTLIAIYISTSDEAIPILLSNPSQYRVILPLLGIKIFLGIFAGYLVDLIFKDSDNSIQNTEATNDTLEDETGCCAHHVQAKHRKRELIIHPLKHTLNIFFMILLISICLNWSFEYFGNDMLNKLLLNNSVLQPVLSAIIGLIPNCAVSVLLTMLYMSGVLTFASVITGLSSGAGLGLIVLLKRNPDIKDSLKIISVLLGISIITGLVLSII